MDEQLPDELIEFITKASVREYDGEMHRVNAESAALQEIVKEFGKEAGQLSHKWRLENK